MCRAAAASRSRYYAREGRSESRRDIENRGLVDKIKAIHVDTKRSYGSRRIHTDLVSQGIVVREAVFNLYGEEIPYSTAVFVDEFKERPGRKDYILVTIYVERESQKAILIGRGGKALKRVGSRARREIEAFLGRPVFLETRVKVAEAWRSDLRFIKENVYGSDQPAGSD
jgi:GTPase Era involved in 16S rRNA processing